MGLLGGAWGDGGVAALEVVEVGGSVIGIVVLEMACYPIIVAAKRVDAFFKFLHPASLRCHGDFHTFTPPSTLGMFTFSPMPVGRPWASTFSITLHTTGSHTAKSASGANSLNEKPTDGTF